MTDTPRTTELVSTEKIAYTVLNRIAQKSIENSLVSEQMKVIKEALDTERTARLEAESMLKHKIDLLGDMDKQFTTLQKELRDLRHDFIKK